MTPAPRNLTGVVEKIERPEPPEPDGWIGLRWKDGHWYATDIYPLDARDYTIEKAHVPNPGQDFYPIIRLVRIGPAPEREPGEGKGRQRDEGARTIERMNETIASQAAEIERLSLALSAAPERHDEREMGAEVDAALRSLDSASRWLVESNIPGATGNARGALRYGALEIAPSIDKAATVLRRALSSARPGETEGGRVPVEAVKYAAKLLGERADKFVEGGVMDVGNRENRYAIELSRFATSLPAERREEKG